MTRSEIFLYALTLFYFHAIIVANATVANITHMLKNSGVIILDKIRIDDLKCVEENARKDFLKHQDKANRQKDTAEKMHGFADNLRKKADAIETSVKKADVEQDSIDMDERE